jgi:pentatricopeptide repeat protein
MYANCGGLTDAATLFESLPYPNVVSWNSTISMYHYHGLHHQAFSSFKNMQTRGQSPNVVTYICVLKCCSCIGFIKKGEEIHALIIIQTSLRFNSALSNTLVHMYVKCGMLGRARGVLEEIPERNTISWSSLISGYAHHQMHDEAMRCFRRMQQEGVFPDVVTFLCILKACGSLEFLATGEEIHAMAANSEKSILLYNTLVDMYAKSQSSV